LPCLWVPDKERGVAILFLEARFLARRLCRGGVVVPDVVMVARPCLVREQRCPSPADIFIPFDFTDPPAYHLPPAVLITVLVIGVEANQQRVGVT